PDALDADLDDASEVCTSSLPRSTHLDRADRGAPMADEPAENAAPKAAKRKRKRAGGRPFAPGQGNPNGKKPGTRHRTTMIAQNVRPIRSANLRVRPASKDRGTKFGNGRQGQQHQGCTVRSGPAELLEIGDGCI